MSSEANDRRLDHRGRPLPPGVYPQGQPGAISGYKVRWREEGADGVPRNAAKSFSARKLGSLDRALEAAVAFREEAVKIAAADGDVPRADPAASMTVGELFQEWCRGRGAEVSKRYAEDSVRRWDREVASRSIVRVRLERLSRDPSIVTRFQDELAADGVTASNRAQVLKTLRAVLRWGRRRHPNALTVELSGLFEIPSQRVRRLAYATDAYGLERIIEAVLRREARNHLLPLRDAAFIAAMGFTVAARPSEWLHSARWRDLHEHSVELQRPQVDVEDDIGLKTGARAALLLPNAAERIGAYRRKLEAEFGPQPQDALVFQSLGEEGPLWEEPDEGGRAPIPWSDNEYKRWTARIWRPARAAAAQAPGAPEGLSGMRFYDCRHTAISLALHSTLVVGPYGMNLHNLAAWAGHDVQTLQRYYAHVIARYQGREPIDLERECSEARSAIAAEPFKPPAKKRPRKRLRGEREPRGRRAAARGSR